MKHRNIFGLFIGLFLGIGVVQADVVVALTCNYLDPKYNGKAENKPVIIFGPTKYIKNGSEIKIDKDSYWKAYNNFLLPYLRPMTVSAVYLVNERSVLKVNGEVYRPHTTNVLRKDETINTNWTLQREDTQETCQYKDVVSNLVDKIYEKLSPKTLEVKPEIWSLDRSFHRKLFLTCTWREIDLPKVKVTTTSGGISTVTDPEDKIVIKDGSVAAAEEDVCFVRASNGDFQNPDDEN